MSKLQVTMVVLVLSGCGESQVGDGSRLRFGLLEQYAETTGFSAPIAQGQSMPLALQAKTKAGLLNDYDFLEGTLTATDPSGAPVEVQRTAQGKFHAVFPTLGTHVLTAQVGEVTDALTVEVAAQAQVRLARMQRSISTDTGVQTCSAALEDGVPVPTLKKNQSLHASLVPADAAGNAMLGLLTVEFTGDIQGTRDAALTANGYTLKPRGTGTVRGTVKDTLTQQTLELSFEVSPDGATCP
jgi:hypothetical protein